MSVLVMTHVFKRYPAGGGEMLLALALADHSDDDGRSIYPSIRRLAEKTRQSERTVQYQLRKMEAMGWLIRVSDGGGRGNTTEFRISDDWLKGADIAPFVPVKRVQPAAERVQSTTEKGATAIAPESSLTIKEPSYARAKPQDGLKTAQPEDELVWDHGEKCFRGISEERMRVWERAFPRLDIDAELDRIELWYAENPKKRKRAIGRFITNWLARTFKARQVGSAPRTPHVRGCGRQSGNIRAGVGRQQGAP